MTPIELANKLYNSGLNIRDAGDIVLWMAEPFHYNHVQGLVALEDVYQERAVEEKIGEMKPAEYRNRIVYLERIIKQLYYKMHLLMQLNDLYYERPPTKPKKKAGITID